MLTLLRSHRDDARGMATMPRHPYPLASIRLAAPITQDALSASLLDAPEGASLRGTAAASAHHHALQTFTLRHLKERPI